MTESLPKISIVVLNWNGGELMERCLGSLMTTDYSDFKVILFDNGSNDGSIEAVEKRFNNNSKLEIIKNPINLGITGGYNMGSKYAQGKYILFMNNDIIVSSKDWLRKLIKVMELDETIGCAQPQLFFPNAKQNTNQIFPFELAIDAFRSKLKKNMSKKDESIKEIFHTVGSAMVVRFDLFKKIGGFDPDFFIMGEDLDLGWRVRLQGFRNVFVTPSKLLHIGGVSLNARAHKLRGNLALHSTMNRLTMLVKNYGTRNLLLYFPVCLVITMISIIVSGNALARLQGTFQFLTNLRRIWTKRMFVQHSIRKVPDSRIVQNNIYTSLFGYGPSLLATAACAE